MDSIDHDQVYEIRFHGKPVNKFPLKNSDVENTKEVVKKKVKKNVLEWNIVNNNKPIWCRKPESISEKECNKF